MLLTYEGTVAEVERLTAERLAVGDHTSPCFCAICAKERQARAFLARMPGQKAAQRAWRAQRQRFVLPVLPPPDMGPRCA